MSGMSEMQRKGAMVWMMETTMRGGVSDLVTRLDRARARTSWMTARTTRPVLKVMTSGSAPPAEGSIILSERRVITRRRQQELFSLSLAVSAGWVQKVARRREATQRRGNTATFLSSLDLRSITRLTSMSM